MKTAVVIAIAILATPIWAQDLRLPSNAELTSELTQPDTGSDFPTGPWVNGAVPTQAVAGNVLRRSWRIDSGGLSSEQIMRSLREQIANAGFEIDFSCETAGCGGFDFRFALDVARPPEMQVNLADFRFLTARRDEQGIMIIASRTREAGFLQITQVGTSADETTIQASAGSLVGAVNVAEIRSIAEQLDLTGSAVLRGLEFATGSSQLGDGPFESLQALSEFLETRPDLNVALVGHTDSEGSLEGNIRLSKRRAGSVLERLVSDFGTSRQRLEAQGMGYLAPVANNLTADGREANRRVEVIITSTRD